MMTRGENNQVTLLKELFEAHLGPLREDIRDIKSNSQAAIKRADEAHERINKYENRVIGWIMGSGISGGGIGYFLSHFIK